MSKKAKDLSKNILLFSIGGFVPKLLSVFLVPLYTGYLSTTQYGIVDILTVTVSLLVPIFTLGIQDAVMRFSLDNEYDKSEIFSNAIKIIIFGSIFVFAGAATLSTLNIYDFDRKLLLFFCVMYIITAINNTVVLFCKGIDKVRVLTVSSILHSVILLLSNIIFLTVFHWGLYGYLGATVLSSGIAVCYSFCSAKLYSFIRWKTNKRVQREMVLLSLPLIINGVAWWINNASDRYFLSLFSGVAITGVYAIAYKIPNILSSLQNILAQAWSISAIKEFDKDDKDGFIGTVYSIMCSALILTGAGLIVTNVPIAQFLFKGEYFEAWKYVPLLVVSVVFNGVSLFLGSIFLAIKDTRIISLTTILGAMVNTVGNIVFVYLWDAYGAALATLLGYAAVLVVRQVAIKKYISMKINKSRNTWRYILLLLQMLLGMLGTKWMGLQIAIFAALIWVCNKEILLITKTIRDKVLKLEFSR